MNTHCPRGVISRTAGAELDLHMNAFCRHLLCRFLSFACTPERLGVQAVKKQRMARHDVTEY